MCVCVSVQPFTYFFSSLTSHSLKTNCEENCDGLLFPKHLQHY